MRLYKGAGRPGRTQRGLQNVRFYRDFGPQISMGAENFHGGGTHLWRNLFSLPLLLFLILLLLPPPRLLLPPLLLLRAIPSSR